MAQSFGVPGRECSVAEFDALRVAGQVEAAWKGYCDCMFIESAEVNDFTSSGTAIIRCIGDACTKMSDGSALAQVTPVLAAGFVTDYCRQNGTEYGVNVYWLPRATPQWAKCMSNFCLAPGGCPNPADPSVIMPFNADPGSSLSPWTDVGAAARMIPKRSAGFFYDVTAMLHIDLAAYEPLKLWQTFWGNPFLFGILMTKIQLIPLVGAAYATANTFTGVPVFLIPGATQTAAEKGAANGLTGPALDAYVIKEVWETAGMGLLESAKFLVAYVGKCGFGIPGACGVAMAIQKAAQDQIKTGEINNVASQEGKAIIHFFAESGSELVDALINIVKNPGRGFSGVFNSFQSGFLAVKNAAGVSDDLKKVCDLIATVFGVAYQIALGLEGGTDPLGIADNVANYLLGFRPSEYFAMINKGQKQSALDSAQTSMERTGNTVQGMVDKADAISTMLDKVVNAINDFANKIGADFSALTNMVGGMRSDIAASTAAVTQVGQQLDAATRVAFQLPAGPIGVGGKTPPAPGSVQPLPGLQTVAPPTASLTQQRENAANAARNQVTLTRVPTPTIAAPPRPPPTQLLVQPTPGGLAPILAGAGAGFLVGGPVGAVAGAAAFALLSKK